MKTSKPENGVHITATSDKGVEIEGRLEGQSPIRAIVKLGEEPTFEILSVRALSLRQASKFARLLEEVITAAELAQNRLQSRK
jgi:hypothetical protein